MSRLIIIGNGFDLYHGLNSRYSDFRKWLYDNYNDYYVDIMYYNKHGYFGELLDENWSNIENALDLNYEIIYQSNDSSNRIINDIYNTFKKLFHEWIAEVEFSICSNYFHIKKTKLNNIYADDYFISFNYTNLLKKIYDISHCHKNGGLHIYPIHNNTPMCPKDLDDFVNNRDPINDIVFGNINNNNNKIDDSLESTFKLTFSKDTEYIFSKLDSIFLSKINEKIDEIYVLGHSIDLNNGDYYYFEKLAEKFSKANWFISFYCDNEYNKDRLHKEKIKRQLSDKFKLNIKIGTIKELMDNDKKI